VRPFRAPETTTIDTAARKTHAVNLITCARPEKQAAFTVDQIVRLTGAPRAFVAEKLAAVQKGEAAS
jgi:hypothetical protein